jgi:hypothetical protein
MLPADGVAELCVNTYLSVAAGLIIMLVGVTDIVIIDNLIAGQGRKKIWQPSLLKIWKKAKNWIKRH